MAEGGARLVGTRGAVVGLALRRWASCSARRGGITARVVVVLALTATCAMCAFTIAPAQAASGLSWSAPAPISHGSAFTGVSCPTSKLCVAVDQNGDVVSSTHPAGGSGAWTTTSLVSDSGLDGVACPAAQLCVVSDGLTGKVLTSSDPAGGAGAWTATNIVNPSGDLLNGVACATTRLCVAVDSQGNVLTSTNPTGGPGAWTSTNVDSGNTLDGVSCAATGLCVAVGAGFATSSNPTGGSGAWTTTTSLDASAVSCPTSLLCVAVDGNGNAYSSTDPTGGPAAWKMSDNIDRLHPFQPMTGVSCPTTRLCVAVGLSGDAVTSTNPTRGSAAWTGETIDTASGLTGVSCPTSSMCLAVDQTGDAVVGTPRPMPLRAAITSTRARVSHGRAKLELACTGGGPSSRCRGTLSLTIRIKRHTIVLASQRYTLASGTKKQITMRLKRTALVRRARARKHRLRVRATATVRGAPVATRIIIL